MVNALTVRSPLPLSFAKKYNAENILIIDNKMLAQKYIQNWQTRRNASKLILEKRDG